VDVLIHLQSDLLPLGFCSWVELRRSGSLAWSFALARLDKKDSVLAIVMVSQSLAFLASISHFFDLSPAS
jgi:hypothetical protein